MIKFNRFKRKLNRLFFEFIAAFMGVLIAMFVSNWEQDRTEKKFIERSISSICLDNVQNLKHLDLQLKSLQHHLDTFAVYRENENLSLINVVAKSKGFELFPLQDGGWQILERSNLIHRMDYDIVSTLQKLDDQLKMLIDKRERAKDILYQHTYDTSSKQKKTFRMTTYALYSSCEYYQTSALKLDSLLRVKYPDCMKN